MQFQLTELIDTKKEFCLECGFNPDEVVLESEPRSTDPSIKFVTLKLGGDLHTAMKTKPDLELGDDICVYRSATLFFNQLIRIRTMAVQELEQRLNKRFGEKKVREKGYLEGLGLYVEASDSGGMMISARKKDSTGRFKTICNVDGENLTKALEKLSSSECWDT